jgi:WD40 repeat protein
VFLWDVTGARPLVMLTGHAAELVTVAFSPGARLLASAGRDGTVKVWNVATGDEERSWEPSRVFQKRCETGCEFKALAFTPDERSVLASEWGNQEVAVLDVHSGQVVRRRLNRRRGSGISHVAFSPDGTWLAHGNGGYDEGTI